MILDLSKKQLWMQHEQLLRDGLGSFYELTESNRKITVVNYLNVDKIYKDLFKKLGENYETNK